MFSFKCLALPVNGVVYSCKPQIGVNFAAPYKDVDAPHSAVEPVVAGCKDIFVVYEEFKL